MSTLNYIIKDHTKVWLLSRSEWNKWFKRRPLLKKTSSCEPSAVGEKSPGVPVMRRCRIFFTTGQWPCHRQSGRAGDGKSWFGVKPPPWGTGCQQRLWCKPWPTQHHKDAAETLRSSGSQASGPAGLSVHIQLLIYQSWPMMLAAQWAEWGFALWQRPE